jgi:hypothetical protein
MEMVIDFPGGAAVDAHFGSYTVHTDQPPAGGGLGAAPTPFAMFLAPWVPAPGFMCSVSASSAGFQPMVSASSSVLTAIHLLA